MPADSGRRASLGLLSTQFQIVCRAQGCPAPSFWQPCHDFDGSLPSQARRSPAWPTHQVALVCVDVHGAQVARDAHESVEEAIRAVLLQTLQVGQGQKRVRDD